MATVTFVCARLDSQEATAEHVSYFKIFIIIIFNSQNDQFLVKHYYSKK